MSGISQEFINDLGFLYENIHIKDQDFLNEESEYYEEETAELAEDIILSLALTMFSEGYTAETFIKFLANSNEEDILEKYLTTDVTFISEETIHNEFVEEQLELLEVAGLIKLLGRGAKAAASGIKAGVKASKSAVKKGVTKAAEAGVEKRIGKQFAKSGDLSRTQAAVEKIAKSKASKAGITVPQGSLSPKQATNLIKQARTARAIQGVKTAAKGALIGGAGVLTGYLGAKIGSGGKGETQDGGRPEPSSPTQETPPQPSTSSGGGAATPAPRVTPSTTPAKPKPSQGNAQYRELIKQGKTKEAEKLGKEQWAKNFPQLAAKVNPDGTQRGTGQSKMERDAEELRQMQNRSKQRQGSLMGGPEGPGKIDTSSVQSDIQKEKERLKKKSAEIATTTKEAYEIILEYLIDTEQVDTLEEAHYVMLEMDSETVGSIVENYEDYLLAEEIEEWVDSLVEEGYDLSEYTWDDMVEYYITESSKV